MTNYTKTFIRDIVMFPYSWIKHLWLIDRDRARVYHEQILVHYWGRDVNPVVRWTIAYLDRKRK